MIILHFHLHPQFKYELFHIYFTLNQLNQVSSRMSSRSSKLTPSLRLVLWQTLAITVPLLCFLHLLKFHERLVYNQLNHFLENEKILFKHQFGLRKNYSTEQAILELTDNLKMKIDCSEVICSIFLDLSKAFDTVNHQILLQTLYRCGIIDAPLQWFKSYIESRTQYAEIEN